MSPTTPVAPKSFFETKKAYEARAALTPLARLVTLSTQAHQLILV